MGHKRSEARVATHDGFLWPVDRHEMRAHEAIRQRMVEDLKRLKREAGENAVDLCEAGWTAQQVTLHGHAAKQRLDREEYYEAERRSEGKGFSLARQFSRTAAELACLALFTGMVGVWAIILGA